MTFDMLRLLFIHHSCGGQWLAPRGADLGSACIYESAVNGGGLRDRLKASGYEVHEASYGSRVGDRTDIFDWPVKFRERMDDVLRCDRQDALYADRQENHIVVFKSCFPNNLFVGPGAPPGDPEGPELTLANAMAAYRALLPEFRQHPATLFVAVTAPPLARTRRSLRTWIRRRLLGGTDPRASAEHARDFNNWLKDAEEGCLCGYPGSNVVVFDLFDVLTDYGKSNFSGSASGPGHDDNHPSAEGNALATDAFVPFLNRAVRSAGLVQGQSI